MITTKWLVFRFSDVEVDENERRVTRGDQVLEVEPKAFKVLLCLLKQAGHLVSKADLISTAWGETAVTDNSLTRAIAILRRVLEDDPHQPKFIETVSTAGYRFICSVETKGSATASAADEVPVSALALHLQSASTSALTETESKTWLRSTGWLGIAAVLAVLGIAVGWWRWWSTPPVTYVTSIEAITHDRLPKIWPLTDGARVYFTEPPKLAQVSAGGGEASTIATPFEWSFAIDIAPDKSSLLIADLQWGTNPTPLWMLPLPGGAPQRVGNLSADWATLTPDGNQILFTKDTEIWRAKVDGSQERKLLTVPGLAFKPQVSPNGERIRFSVSEEQLVSMNGLEGWPAGTLWEANSDGSNAHRLLPGWQEHPSQVSGSWSPDGQQYVFSVGTRRSSDLWLIPGGRVRFLHRRPTPLQLTRGPIAFWDPIFSTDGRTLFAVGVELHGELIRLNPATHQPSVYLSGTSATEVAFSPDGQWITYITFPDYILWRSRTDGRDRRQLTSPSGYAEMPRWSPDGKRIAFNWSDAGKPWKLAVISSDGGALEGVIPDREDNQQQGDPTWSRDGEEIIYARDMELRRVDLRTRKAEPVPGSEGLFSPRWAPDGRYLAAFSMDSRSIHMFDFEKQVWTIWFTAKEGHVAWNSWSQDSKALYFATDETGNQGYWRIDVGNKIPKKIADLPDQNLWPVLAPDGALIYTRDLSIYEVYALHLSEK